jgi:hypothetical protein
VGTAVQITLGAALPLGLAVAGWPLQHLKDSLHAIGVRLRAAYLRGKARRAMGCWRWLNGGRRRP